MSTFDPDQHRSDDESRTDRLDAATSARLRRLGTLPVDLSDLEARLAIAIPKADTRPANPWRLSLRPVHAIAASLLAGVLTVGVVVSVAARPVVASPQLLEGLYHESAMVEGGHEHPVMACCIQKVKGKPVTCVPIDSNGSRVSMMVAEAKDFRVPEEAVRRDARAGAYYFQSSPKLNMVMAVRGNTWICLMGPVTEAELVKMLANAPSAAR